MKDYREKEMKYLLIVYIFLFLIWCTEIVENIPSAIQNNYSSILYAMEGIVVSGALSISAFLGDSLIGSRTKDMLIGLFFIPRPGYTVFRRISSGSILDDRFTNEQAKFKYSLIIENLPEKSRKSTTMRTLTGTRCIASIKIKGQ